MVTKFSKNSHKIFCFEMQNEIGSNKIFIFYYYKCFENLFFKYFLRL